MNETTHLRRWMDRTDRSIRALADELGAHPATVQGWLECRHRPRPDMLEKLLVLTGLPVEAFIFPTRPLSATGKRTRVA